MSKKIILLGLTSLLLTLTSCAQTTKKQENMSSEYRDKVKNIYKEVKKYDYNPTYQLAFDANLCTYELYINDVLVNFSFTPGRTAGEQNIDIPQFILKSGKQTVRFKIYPKAVKKGVLENLVDKNADFSIRIVHGEYYKMKFEDFKEVFRMKLPKVTVDVPYVELKGEFEAIVPYELEGWSKGMDLSKDDPKKLEEEVLGRMKEIARLYENKDIEGLAKEHYKRVKEVDQSMYHNTKENSAEWEKLMQESLDESLKTELLEGKMKIMGEGKIVTILVDKGSLLNESIIRNRIEGGYSDYFDQYFYRPAPGARLEVIR
ncbi:hypothetical protein [Flavobacterium aquidurense]|uniref:Lipoprotein n=1 Tax=Flavobacterium aquidurense TaxID=362413 RepID=A0A0Q0WVX7_9FLAO|nr:hypothetical protein [Flavobacterium aquidurense]KQB40377.1 hypothetical protein RC62_267 [Flavobacterium aquidurense]